MNKILIIEDDITITEGLQVAFEYHGFHMDAATSGERGMERFNEKKPDLVILDIMLPGKDGYSVCREIRKKDKKIPIIMLTAKGQESDKLLGFELGADDYITKPFSARELIARVRAVLNRSERNRITQFQFQIGEAAINLDNFTLKKSGIEYPLSPKERDILKLLVENPGIVISRDRIIDEVWGGEYFPNPKTIDNFIHKIRGKIEKNPKNPEYILSIHGIGYKLITR